jgi:hypothetical protein
LYGEFDLLVKVKAKNRDDVVRNILEPLQGTNLIGKYKKDFGYFDWGWLIDVRREIYPSGQWKRDLSYSRGMKAFVFCDNVSDPGSLYEIMVATLRDVCSKGSPQCALLSGVFLGDNNKIVAEVFLSCGEFYALDAFVQGIERSWPSGDTTKVTMLAQSIWEPASRTEIPRTRQSV